MQDEAGIKAGREMGHQMDERVNEGKERIAIRSL